MSVDSKIAVLFCKDDSGKFDGNPLVAKIPSEVLNQINLEIADLEDKLFKIKKKIKTMRKENDIRASAAECEDCDLCMVCGGKHRLYESWPPGTGKCFCTLMKKGKPIREEPCSLCKFHDKEIRDFKRAWRQALSRQSNTQRKLAQAISKRRNLFRSQEHSVENMIIKE